MRTPPFYEDEGNYYLHIPDSVHYYTNGSDVVVSSNGSGLSYRQDVAIGPDGFARIAYVNAQSGAAFIQCTNASCGTSSTSAISLSGQYPQAVSIAVGPDGNALIEGGSATGTSNYVDYVSCTAAAPLANCSKYSKQIVPGSWENTGLISLGLGGPDGFVDMIAMDASGFIDKIKPRVVKMKVRFTGSKSSSDQLSFMRINPNACKESLGLADCSVWGHGYWLWNVEIEADVTDDASQWTFTQQAGLSGSGTYKRLGQTYNFPDSHPWGPDLDVVVQQTSGTKTVFSIDAPGRTIWHDPTVYDFLINTVTDTFNLSSKVCSTRVTTKCRRVWWYFKLVVGDGGVLDTNNSVAGNGNK